MGVWTPTYSSHQREELPRGGAWSEPTTDLHFDILGEISDVETFMVRLKGTEPQFAVCIDNRECPASLELHKIYPVLADPQARKHGDLRIIDESGEDYLYPAEWFVIVELPQAVADSVLQASRAHR